MSESARKGLRLPSLFLLIAVLMVMCCGRSATADVTPEQLQELRELKRDLTKVNGLLRKQAFEEAEVLLDEAEAKLQAIMTAADVAENSRILQGVPQLIASRRKALELQRRKSEATARDDGVSFRGDVAPLIVNNCLNCHGADNPRAGLNLSTFAGWKGGGQGGVLLVPGAALKSRLIARLAVNDPSLRMPRGQEALPRESVETIAAWINQGARFDGDNETTSLTELAKPRPDVAIPQPQGTETVSFTKDIAPFMVRLCVRCHSGDAPRGGLSLVSFADMMAGGDSGPVVLPGKREESRLFRLVGGLENPRMPQGQARITRQNYDDLVTWFDEGNVFDGEDPFAPITSYVPTAEQIAAEKFAAMTPDEWAAHRRQRAEEVWKRSLPKQSPEIVETDEFLLIGNITSERLQQVSEWAHDQLQTLERTFAATPQGSTLEPTWKGKLAVLVFKERFEFTEFALSVLDRRDSEGVFGDAVVTPTLSDAYIVLQDVGDEPSHTQPGLRTLMRQQLSSAYIGRGGETPNWLMRGGGLVLAQQSDRANPYFTSLPSRASDALVSISSPVELLADESFSPAAAGPVGFQLVNFLIERTSRARFLELVRLLQQGTSFEEAFRSVTGRDATAFAQAFLLLSQRQR